VLLALRAPLIGEHKKKIDEISNKHFLLAFTKP